jgi:hypothetical protein
MRACLLGTVALAAAAAHAQESDDMARCVDIADTAARLACYDAAVGRNTPAEPEPAPLTEDVGEEQLDPELRPERQPESFRGRVTKCQQDASNKWYFYFDNGQVWKQRSGNRVRFRECDFGVTITKDTFGYKMQVDGETKTIRIGRIR